MQDETRKMRTVIEKYRNYHWLLYAVIMAYGIKFAWARTVLAIDFIFKYVWDNQITIIALIGYAAINLFIVLACVLLGVFLYRKLDRKGPAVLAALCVICAARVTVDLFYAHPNTSKNYRKIEDRLYSFKPDVPCTEVLDKNGGDDCRIEADGFRSCPYTGPGTGRRIALVGDSFVYGWRLPDGDTLCATLGDELVKRNLGEITVKNYGMPNSNFATYAKMSGYAYRTYSPDWIFVGYLPSNMGEGSDILPIDGNTFMALQESPSTVKLLSSLFNFSISWKASQIYNRFVMKHPSNKRIFKRFNESINTFEELSRDTRVVILTYRGRDMLLSRLQKQAKNIDVIDLELKESFKGEFFMPDSHPTANANREYAKRIADFMMEQKSEPDAPPAEVKSD